MEIRDQPEFSPTELAGLLEQFFADHPRAALLEDGRVLFEMAAAHYSISAEHGRCVLHLWSEERNMVRTVVGVQARKETLRLRVRRLGAQRPQSLELIRDRDQRTPTTRALSRTRYLHLLERLLTRHFNEYKIEGLRSAMDLEHSFGPAYARGLLVRGQQCWALIGVNAEETQATIDGVLTLGILWLAYCREHSAGRRVCAGLKLLLPAGCGDTIRARMAWLDRELAQWELYEVDAGSEELATVDTADQGNLKMRLLHAFNPAAAIERAQEGLAHILRLLPPGMQSRVTVAARSAHEVGLSLYGLEFARVRQGFVADSFARQANLTFGAGANETPLQQDTEGYFADLMARLFASRFPGGSARDPLFRLQPEAWLQSTLAGDLTRIDEVLGEHVIYQQVPAFAAADRAMLDLLTATRGGRLAILELKAGEDLHFPLQGLDYWIRVHWLQQRGANAEGELQRNGYFPAIHLLQDSPLLYYVVPALRVHPSMDTILQHFSPAVPWRLIALNEGWRSEPKVIFRKRSATA